MTNHTDVVARVKADLERRGVDLSGPCGAFEITKRVAWELHDEGAGLLSKPDGNNCDKFAVDIIVYPTGQHFDILVSSGEANGPAWNDVGFVDPARWRPPFSVDAPAPPAPPRPDPPPPPPPAPDWAEQLLHDLEVIHTALTDSTKGIAALGEKIDQLRASGLRVHL